MKIDVYSNADEVAQKAAALVASEARAAVGFRYGRQWRAHSVADAACSRR